MNAARRVARLADVARTGLIPATAKDQHQATRRHRESRTAWAAELEARFEVGREAYQEHRMARRRTRAFS